MWLRSRALTPRKACSRRPPHLFFRRHPHKRYRMRKKYKKPARRDMHTMYRRYKKRKRRTRYNKRGVHTMYRRRKKLMRRNYYPYPLLMGTAIPRAGRASGCPALIWLFPHKTVPG